MTAASPRSFSTKLRALLEWGAAPGAVFYLLPPLMLLVIIGTIVQRYVGLYVADQTFFSSIVIWVFGFIPVPGGFTLMALLTANLTIKFLLKSEWSWAKAGISLTHFGVLVLMIGGLLTSASGREGFMTIPEGQSSQTVRDYHAREVMVVKDGQIASAIPAPSLKRGVKLAVGEITPFNLEVLESCRNCAIKRRTSENPDYKSMARGMMLSEAPLMKNNEANTGGITFRVTGLGEADGIYILFEDGPPAQLGGIELVYGKQQRPLPFSVKLKNFQKDVYAGTDTAKAYHSDVLVRDGSLEWPARIEMNQPLRYRGYTFFQSAFMESDGQETTVLAVTENRGRLFPYIATGIIGAGLLLHLLIMLRRRAS